LHELRKNKLPKNYNYSYNRAEQANVSLAQQDEWPDEDIPF
jgi:hypothetical protein